MSWKIPLFKMYSDQDDIDTVASTIKRATFWASGPEVGQFEEKLAQYMGTRYAITFNSGTSALHTILLAHNVKGKEIIVPSFTFISTANAVILAGAKPVFAEVEPDTLGLNAEDVIKRINKNTVGIIVVHFSGFPARDTIKIKEIAKEHDLFYFEDAAESMGASINEKKVGTFGHASILSFCQNKVITTGEGGAIVTDSQKIYEKGKLIRSHGRVETTEDYFTSVGDMDYIEVGYNYRMSSISAALGISQLQKIEYLIKMRRNLAGIFNKNLAKIEKIALLREFPGHFQVYQMYPILLSDEKTRDELQKYLATKGIMTKVYFNPSHLKTIYKRDFGYKEGDLPVTEDLSKRELSLPFYPNMAENDVNYLIKSIFDFFDKPASKLPVPSRKKAKN